MELGLNDFDGGKSITRAIGMGWALKIKAFLGPEMGLKMDVTHIKIILSRPK